VNIKHLITPYQAAFASRSKIIERHIEIDRQDVQPFQANACTGIRHVADTARKNTGMAVEK
jgi:hypothetical protein